MEVEKAKPCHEMHEKEDEHVPNQNTCINFHEKTKDTLQILADSISKELDNYDNILRRKTKSDHVGNNKRNFANNEKKYFINYYYLHFFLQFFLNSHNENFIFIGVQLRGLIQNSLNLFEYILIKSKFWKIL